MSFRCSLHNGLHRDAFLDREEVPEEEVEEVPEEEVSEVSRKEGNEPGVRAL